VVIDRLNGSSAFVHKELVKYIGNFERIQKYGGPWYFKECLNS